MIAAPREEGPDASKPARLSDVVIAVHDLVAVLENRVVHFYGLPIDHQVVGNLGLAGKLLADAAESLDAGGL